MSFLSAKESSELEKLRKSLKSRVGKYPFHKSEAEIWKFHRQWMRDSRRCTELSLKNIYVGISCVAKRLALAEKKANTDRRRS